MKQALDAIQRHGDMSVPLPPGPPFFRFSDPGECMRVLQDAGFESPRVDLVPQVWRLRSPEVLFDIMLHSTVRTAALLGAQTPHALDAIRDELRDATAAFRNGDAISDAGRDAKHKARKEGQRGSGGAPRAAAAGDQHQPVAVLSASATILWPR